ncbi:hypothetical protein D3C85_1818160 [compost metagenome]
MSISPFFSALITVFADSSAVGGIPSSGSTGSDGAAGAVDAEADGAEEAGGWLSGGVLSAGLDVGSI